MAVVYSRLIETWNRKESRENRRITIKEVSEKTGVSRDVISRMLNDKTGRFDADVVAALCDFFDVPEDEPVPFLVFTRNLSATKRKAAT